MASSNLAKLDALFAFKSEQSSSLSIRVAGDGTLKVKGLSRCAPKRGYPSRESLERSGNVYQEEADLLASGISAIATGEWYHHYLREQQSPYWIDRYWWNIRMEYADGKVKRWEGVNDAPGTLQAAYDALTSFGMPTLRLGFGDRLSNMLPSYCGEKSLDRITCYERLFEEAQSLDHELSSDDETSQVLDELLDDIWLYLRLNPQELQPDEVLAMWDVPVGLDAMLGMDVERASRIQMMGLLGAMMRLPNPKSAMEAAVVDGSFARWIERLRQIPRDEEAERERCKQERRQQLIGLVDREVRRHIEVGDVFTSHDVAVQTGASAQQASTRIRSYVREGQLQTVGDDYPRRYKAA